MTQTTILSVRAASSAKPQRMWVVTTPEGQWATRNMWKASICQRAMERQKQVRIWGGGGWYYKQIDTVEEV